VAGDASHRDLVARSAKYLVLGFTIQRSPKSRQDKGSSKSSTRTCVSRFVTSRVGSWKIENLASRVAGSR
jgi:hypothetical protein